MASTNSLVLAGLNLIQQALSVFDSNLRLVHANTPMQKMFDLPDALSTPGARFEAVIRYLAEHGEYGPIDDLDSFVQARVDLARAFEPHYMERTRANGRTISVEGAPLPEGGWVTVYTDITQVKSHERLLHSRSALLSEEVLARSEELAATNRQLAATIAALEETRRELTEMEARTRATAEMMPAHLARIDAEGRYTYSNRRLSAVMPGRPANILGSHIKDTLGPAFAKVQAHVAAAQDGRQATVEFTDDASSRRIRAVFTPDPVDPGVFILSQDVTEETQARAALQQTRRRALAAQLTSGLAHDFSNLLTIILGMQARLARMAPSPEAMPLIQATSAAARRGGVLLDRIAGVTGPRAWRPEPHRLGDLLDDLRVLASPALPDGLTLDLHSGIADPVMLDPGMVQDSLLNLILNARDACALGGTITVAARCVQDIWIEITVTDTGPGFTEAALVHGLDPFFTTKGGEGSGLGLAMVYDMAKLAGGTVRLANCTQGARVTLRLPLRTAAAARHRGLVLLVDDSPDLRATVRDMLMDLGQAVIEAQSVDEACALRTTVPDISLVLSDIRLEGAPTGLDLLDRLPDIPVVLMTSLPASHPLHAQARARATVLAKPFTAAQLDGILPMPRSAA